MFLNRVISTESFAPVTRPPFHVHDGDDPKVVGLFQINDGVGKIAADMSERRRVKFPESFRAGTDFAEQAFLSR